MAITPKGFAGEAQAVAFQRRFRDLGERHVVSYQGGGWFRVYKPGHMVTDGLRRRKAEIERQLLLMEGRAAPRG